MAMIEIESPRGDVGVQTALGVLRQANIKARRRTRSLKISGLVQVPDADAERAVNLLIAANIRASIRPS
jgi:hypothetical protein